MRSQLNPASYYAKVVRRRPRSSCFPEPRERAVRKVADVRASNRSEWAAIEAVAAKLGVRTAETLRGLVRLAEVDAEIKSMGSSCSVRIRGR